MKHKQGNMLAEEFDQPQQGDGLNETGTFQLSENDKEKGNLKNFNISKKMIKKLKARNIQFLFPIQKECYSSIRDQKDCLIQASHGSGKTLAFVIPVVELLQSDESVELAPGRAPRVVILSPSRDTIKQICDDFQSIASDLSIVGIYSSKKKTDEQEVAVANGSDVLVATSDRLKEFIDNEKIDLSQVKHFIIDDIDLMLEESVIDNIKAILKQVFASETKAQLIVLSEIMPDSTRKLLKKYLTADCIAINLAEQKVSPDKATDEDESEEADETTPFANGSGKTDQVSSGSLLSKLENYTTYQLTTKEEIKGIGFVFTIMRKCLGEDFDAKGTIAQIAFTKDFTSAVFDLPSEYDEQIQNQWKDSATIQMGPITELPELDEASMNDFKNSSRSDNKFSRGGANRNSARSNACFNCQQEGHKSWECPQSNGAQFKRNNAKSGGCFNCGKDGHRSFECTEPKKAGGRSDGGERSNACFNCGKDGHKSFECTEPKKGGGRSGGCFNCGKDGHKSFECTEPKKAGGRPGAGDKSGGCFNCGKDGHKSFECTEPKKGRPSAGGGGRGGGRGGARGGGAKRSFGANYENGQSNGEATNKKIKFDDDD